MRTGSLRLVAVPILSLFFAIPTVATTIQSTFDADAEGWTASGAIFSHSASGGNPDGHIQLSESGGGNTQYHAIAPTAFHGDLSDYDLGNLSFDAIILSQRGPNTLGFGIVSISGGGIHVSRDFAPDIARTSWTTYLRPMTAASWGLQQAEWETLLSDVTDIRIRLDVAANSGTTGFDNFALKPVPEPSTALLVGLGLVGIAARRRRLRE
jgi:hypothetical protein